jgi:hypothetical protein
MGFLSEAAAKATASSAGRYFSPNKIENGASVRFALLSGTPLEFFEVWGTAPDGSRKAFRFEHEPTPEDIYTELGDYTPNESRNKPGSIEVNLVLALPIYHYPSEEVKVFTMTQKSIIREFDALSQMEEYADLTSIDFDLSKKVIGEKTEYKLRTLPRKKGADVALSEAAEELKWEFDISRLLTGGNPFKTE